MGDFIYTFSYNMILAAVIGFISSGLGNLVPKRLIDARKFPFKEHRWEHGGKAYTFLAVDKWKTKAPDVSKHFKWVFCKRLSGSMDKEYIDNFITETCVAEMVHYILIFISPVFFLWNNIYWGRTIVFLYIVGNLPFIIIQRYNRPRLIRLEARYTKSTVVRDMQIAGEKVR